MRGRAWFHLLCGVVLIFFSSVVMGGETSPYLIGAWEDDGSTIYTDLSIVNPNPVTLNVYAAFFKSSGEPIEGKCFTKVLAPNANWNLRGEDLGLNGFGSEGTVKFVAVEQGKSTYDRDLGIGGYQSKWLFEISSSQVNLIAVVLNRRTIAEIKEILELTCTPW